jgi:hypothetical protein
LALELFKREFEMKFAAINASSSGINTIVAAISDKKIRVVSYVIIAAGAVTAAWQSGSTPLSGPMSLAASGGASASIGILAPIGTYGLFQTNANEALNLNLGGAVNVSGHLCYILVGV